MAPLAQVQRFVAPFLRPGRADLESDRVGGWHRLGPCTALAPAEPRVDSFPDTLRPGLAESFVVPIAPSTQTSSAGRSDRTFAVIAPLINQVFGPGLAVVPALIGIACFA